MFMMKKIKILLIGLMLTMPCSVFAQNYVYGDVNGDGEVNIADVNVIIDIILGRTVDEKTLERADVNEDSEINIADVNAVLDIILN